MASTRRIQGLGLVALVGVVYFLLAALGLRLTAGLGFVSSLWPANGVLLAALIKSPRRLWPGLLGSSLLANAAASVLVLGATWPTAALFTLPTVVETLLAVALLARFVGLEIRFITFGQSLRFVLLAAVVPPFFAASLGASIDHALTGHELWRSLLTWWAADAIGILLVTPAILVWRRSLFARLRDSHRVAEALGMLFVLVSVTTLVFGPVAEPALPVAFLVIPPLLWAGIRFGVFTCAATGLLTAALAVFFTAQGFGPFANLPQASQAQEILILQSFLVVASFLPLMIAIALAERRRTHSALRASEDRYRAFIANSNEAIWRLDLRRPMPLDLAVDEQIRWLEEHAFPAEVNEAYLAHFGFRSRQEVLRAKLGEVFPGTGEFDLRQVRIAAEKRYSGKGVETREHTQDGGRKIFLNNYSGIVEKGFLLGIWGASTDITAMRRAEEAVDRQRQELQETEKMVALGTLVSAMAHEVSNPNHCIMLNLPILKSAWLDALPILDRYAAKAPELTLANLPYSEMRQEIPQLLEEISGCSERIRAIVADLRQRTRERGGETQRLQINDVVRSVLRLVASPIEAATDRFAVLYGEDLPEVEGYPLRLEQVVINLVVNACQALTDRDQAIVVETGLRPGSKSLVVRVRDEGRGISPADLPKVQEPFFTTREASGGSGLGLAIARRIAREHGGQLEIRSEAGAGTDIRLVLPVLADRLTAEIPILGESP